MLMTDIDIAASLAVSAIPHTHNDCGKMCFSDGEEVPKSNSEVEEPEPSLQERLLKDEEGKWLCSRRDTRWEIINHEARQFFRHWSPVSGHHPFFGAVSSACLQHTPRIPLSIHGFV